MFVFAPVMGVQARLKGVVDGLDVFAGAACLAQFGHEIGHSVRFKA